MEAVDSRALTGASMVQERRQPRQQVLQQIE